MTRVKMTEMRNLSRFRLPDNWQKYLQTDYILRWIWLVKEERFEFKSETKEMRRQEEEKNQSEWRKIDAVKAGEDV